MKTLCAIAALAATAAAQAAYVTIDFETQFGDPLNRPAVLDDELAAAPYWIEFGGSPDLVGFGDVELDARLSTNEIIMRPVDGFVFNNFSFEIEVDEFLLPQVITIEVTTADGTTSVFGSYVGNGSDGNPFNNNQAFFFPSISAADGFVDITEIRVFDTGRLFKIDNLSYNVSVIPLPHAAGLAGVGILGLARTRPTRR
jgi:hypothetical protein